MDDRIQVANTGLVKAALKFAPGGDKDGRITPFLSFASSYIKTEIARYVRGAPDAHEKPFHIPAGTFRDVNRAHADDWQEHFTPEKREELLGYGQVNHTTPLDGLYFGGAADEEIEQDGDDPPLLWAGEVMPNLESDDPSYEFFEAQLSERIDELFSRLYDREAGIVRLRFGFNEEGKQHSAGEIGDIYGLTQERIRQILNSTRVKLHYLARSVHLDDFASMEDEGRQPFRSGDVVKGSRTIGRSLMHLAVSDKPDMPQSDRSFENWQAYPGERWEDPVRKSGLQLEAEYADTGRRFKELIFGASLYTFQKSFTEDVRSPYPKLLVERIKETFGGELAPAHIAEFWNNHLESFLQHISNQLGEDANPDRATQLLSRLFGEYMSDNDVIELRIPKSMQGKLGYVGAWLSHGRLRILGDLGDNAGHEMEGLGYLQVEGGAGHFAGNRMGGHARLEIDGDAGNFAGFAMKGSASILVNGDVGSYCGHRMNSAGASIEILGDAGSNLAYQALKGDIIVGGKRFAAS